MTGLANLSGLHASYTRLWYWQSCNFEVPQWNKHECFWMCDGTFHKSERDADNIAAVLCLSGVLRRRRITWCTVAALNIEPH
jgi:hypothetical protein